MILALTIATAIVLAYIAAGRLLFVIVSDSLWERACYKAMERTWWDKLLSLLLFAASLAGIALLWGWVR